MGLLHLSAAVGTILVIIFSVFTSLNLCEEYVNVVACNIPALIQIKNKQLDMHH